MRLNFCLPTRTQFRWYCNDPVFWLVHARRSAFQPIRDRIKTCLKTGHSSRGYLLWTSDPCRRQYWPSSRTTASFCRLFLRSCLNCNFVSRPPVALSVTCCTCPAQRKKNMESWRENCDRADKRTAIKKAEEWSMSNFPCSLTEILHYTVWRTWLFIAYSDESLIILSILTTSLIHFLLGRLGEWTFWAWEWKG